MTLNKMTLFEDLLHFAGAAIIKHHTLAGSNNGNVFPNSSRGYKSKTKEWAGWVSSEASLPGL